MEIIRGEIIVKYVGTKPYPFDWELVEPIHVKMSNGVLLKIPVGFVTDFTSVPQRLWSLIAPTGQYNLAAIIHDYLYTHHIYARRFADREFELWMDFLTPDKKFRNKIMYICLRFFGKARFLKYAEPAPIKATNEK